ncbi:VOC family protein [Rhodobacter sp. SY28-1]|uniref:VOC family protein n=1 Tax=Rhodobacter sp. SY28-1 TaxID=2562317 RepID=UPI0010C07F28|nr:VOC family protein [Rhodobacter sp. SY28-1]
MKVTSYYPVLLSEDVARAAAFYIAHFRFRPLYQADWYIHLQSSEDPKVNLGLVAKDHETIPEVGRGRTGALLLNFEVEDVDGHYARLQADGAVIALGLRDEAFGQRHFIVEGPDGVLIDMIRPIPPSGEHAALYAAEALPT